MCHDCKHISNIIVSYYFPQYRQLWEVLLQLQNTPNDYIIVRIFLASFRKFCSVFQDNVFPKERPCNKDYFHVRLFSEDCIYFCTFVTTLYIFDMIKVWPNDDRDLSKQLKAHHRLQVQFQSN